jgi:hypothetical protein
MKRPLPMPVARALVAFIVLAAIAFVLRFGYDVRGGTRPAAAQGRPASP